MKILTDLLIVCVAKVYELTDNLAATDEEVTRLQALHISTFKLPEPSVFEIPKSKLDVLELNLKQTINQIQIAKASLPTEAPSSYGIFADGCEGVGLALCVRLRMAEAVPGDREHTQHGREERPRET